MGIERIPLWAWLPVGLIVGALFAGVYTEQPSDQIPGLKADYSQGSQGGNFYQPGGLLWALTQKEWLSQKNDRIQGLRILPPRKDHEGKLIQEATFQYFKPMDPQGKTGGWVDGRVTVNLPFPEKTALIVTGIPQAFESIGTMLLDPNKKHRQPIEAKTLDDAQRALRRQRVDFVVCDMTIAGAEIAKPLANQIAQMNRKVPMIILVDAGEVPAAGEMVKQGAVGYVLKGDKAAWASATAKAAAPEQKTSQEGKDELGRLASAISNAVSPMIEKAFPDQTLRAEVERLKIQQKKDPNAVQVHYRYVWWAEDRARYAVWMTGGALVIGVIWPLALWLLVGAGFGRAAEPKTSERKHSAVPESPKPEKVGMTDDDTRRLLEMEAEMEAKLAAGGIALTEAPAADQDDLTEGQIKALSAGPLESPKEQKPEEKKEYAGEFYPTATRVTKKP